MPSPAYDLFFRAMAEKKQVVCRYDDLPRELCPIILGHSDGVEKALTFQFGGQTSGGSVPWPGTWKCLDLGKVRDAVLRDGPWHAGDSHLASQRCVKEVDIDVNPQSPYHPARRL
jgi:hypothetical protein